jgi:hypothetical protein
LGSEVNGAAWAEELGRLPHLGQLTRDAGTGLAKGVALLNARRHAQGRPPVVDQADHYHAPPGAAVGFRQARRRAQKAVAEAEAAQEQFEACRRRGVPANPAARRAAAARRRAERAVDGRVELAGLWQRTEEALRLFTPAGQLNTRQQAQAVLAQTFPPLPAAFAKPERMMRQPEVLNYLDYVQRQLEALPLPAEVTQAAVRQEGLRRRPELPRGEGKPAAALRGVLLACAVVLGRAGEAGRQAVAAVRDIPGRAYRASSLVECTNSVVRMQQARHRKLAQGLLDLKRLHWNGHAFRTGRRCGTSPYQRLGVPLPAGLSRWQLLKLIPEQLREKLSTARTAA